ncbi:MAG: isoprenylcysteine carboxylmethyltransferase family protein [Candidatus Krumholzibacteriia bacterium]
MIKLGNFLFRHRNKLFPLFYVFLFVPSPTIFANPFIPLAAGLGIALAGQLIRVATIGLKYIIRGGRHRRVYAEDLVTDGLFAHVRNPLYVGNILVIVGLGVMSNSLLFNLILTPIFLVFYQAIVRAEEDYLQGKFGQDFVRYCADVHRWWPRFGGLATTMRSMEFRWSRVVVKEYGSTFLWLTGAVLVVLKTVYVYRDGVYFADVRGPLLAVEASLLVLYLTARYLKKSRRLSGD